MSDYLYKVDENLNLSCLKYKDGTSYLDGNDDYDLNKIGSALEVLEGSLIDGYSTKDSILLALKVLKNDFETY